MSYKELEGGVGNILCPMRKVLGVKIFDGSDYWCLLAHILPISANLIFLISANHSFPVNGNKIFPVSAGHTFSISANQIFPVSAGHTFSISANQIFPVSAGHTFQYLPITTFQSQPIRSFNFLPITPCQCHQPLTDLSQSQCSVSPNRRRRYETIG